MTGLLGFMCNLAIALDPEPVAPEPSSPAPASVDTSWVDLAEEMLPALDLVASDDVCIAVVDRHGSWGGRYGYWGM